MEDSKQRNEESYEAKKVRGINNTPMLRHILRAYEQYDAGGDPSAQTEKISEEFSEIKTDETNVPIKQSPDGYEACGKKKKTDDLIASALRCSCRHRLFFVFRAGFPLAVPSIAIGTFLFQNDITYLKSQQPVKGCCKNQNDLPTEDMLLQINQCARRCSTQRFVSNRMRSSSSVRSSRFSMRMRPSTMTVSTEDALAE